MGSWNWPALANKLKLDVEFIRQALVALLKMDPTGIDDTPDGAKKLTETATDKVQLQKYSGKNWKSVGKLMHDVDQLDGYHASVTPTKNTIPVRDANSKIPGDITGNAATATKASELADGAIVPVSQGGTGASTSAQARANLEVPPANHASSGTTYGVSSTSNYGHAKASSTTPKAAGTASPGSENSSFAKGDHVHPAQTSVSGNAGTATKLQTARTISLSGDATGSTSFDGSANKSIAVTLANSGAAAGAYGPTASDTLTFGESVNVPQMTVDAKGRITKAAHYAIKLPAAPTSVSGNAGTATKLQTARTIDGVDFNGSAAITHYCSCSTDAATAAKTVALSGFKLVTGAVVFVRFTVTNSAANPTLNVNNTGAKAIQYRNANISAGYLAANRTYAFVYDGSSWEFIGDINTDTKYTAATATPKAPGTAAVGTSTKYAREDHVHPTQTSVSGSSGSCTGNAATATKLQTARTITVGISNITSGKASFDGSGNISISMPKGNLVTQCSYGSWC